MLDLNALFNGGVAERAWETPIDAEALIPGNAICLGGLALPAGSSFSAAILTGWAFNALADDATVTTIGDGPWTPAWEPNLGCWVLRQGSRAFRTCNSHINELFASLNNPQNACWNSDQPRIVSAPALGIPVVEPALPSLEWYSATTHPTPESDPCVPCSGWDLAGGSRGVDDLTINLSQSGTLPAGSQLDTVFLRVDDDYYPVELPPEALGGIQRGDLTALRITSALTVMTPQSSLSLWYRLRPDELDGSCESSGGASSCFWTSTPIRLMAPFVDPQGADGQQQTNLQTLTGDVTDEGAELAARRATIELSGRRAPERQKSR